MKALSINYPKLKEDDDKLDELISTYQSKQSNDVLTQMDQFKVPPLVLDKNTNPMKSFGV